MSIHYNRRLWGCFVAGLIGLTGIAATEMMTAAASSAQSAPCGYVTAVSATQVFVSVPPRSIITVEIILRNANGATQRTHADLSNSETSSVVMTYVMSQADIAAGWRVDAASIVSQQCSAM